MIDPTVADRLIRLRTLHQRAMAAAADTTPAGQHEAIVALDGVVEQALLLAATELGITPREKDSLVDVHGKVCGELGARWLRPGNKAIIELHRSRNNVQHHGVLPREDHLPVWLTESDRYIGSLVTEVFHVALEDVHAADAVATEDLRVLLLEAELALAAGDTDTVLRRTDLALARASGEFRRQRHGSGLRTSVGDFGEFREIAKALDAINEFVDIAYFAADPGDGLWFKALGQRRFPSGTKPELSDAQRAFGFVLSWVLRWEAFVARQPQRGDYVHAEAAYAFSPPVRGAVDHAAA